MRTSIEKTREIANLLNESNTSLSDDNGNFSEDADPQSDSDIEPNSFEMSKWPNDFPGVLLIITGVLKKSAP